LFSPWMEELELSGGNGDARGEEEEQWQRNWKERPPSPFLCLLWRNRGHPGPFDLLHHRVAHIRYDTWRHKRRTVAPLTPLARESRRLLRSVPRFMRALCSQINPCGRTRRSAF
jgi:hypothetical protein